jgi:outer membrane cobalamin receptor
MKKTATLVFAYLAAAVPVLALPMDSTKTFSLDEVVVTATRTPIPVAESPSPVEVIDGRMIREMNGTTVGDVLRSSSSVFLKERGAGGALKTLSLRGTASEHVLVLVNGTRFNNFQNGSVDLGLLPVNDVERIEIARGGSSALYGADALGGVVNVMTRRADSKLRARTELAVGSFGYQRLLQEGQGRTGAVGLLAGYASERARDDYAFALHRLGSSDTTVERHNDDFHRKQFYLHGDVNPDEQSLILFSAQSAFTNRGVPGPTSFLSEQARQNDDDANFSLTYSDRRFDRLHLTLATAFRYGLQRYIDPASLMDSYYKNTLFAINPQIQLYAAGNNVFVFGAEFAEGLLNSNDFDGRIRRVQKSLYLSNEFHFRADRDIFDLIGLYQTVRYDNISDVDVALTPKLGMNVRLVKNGDLRLRSSIGQSFRSPSFNDLYYRGFSNPNLKPERSTSFDAGLLTGFEWFGRHRLEVSYFHLHTENRILFDPALFVPVNIGRASSNGMEVVYEGKFVDGLLSVSTNYSYTDVQKKDRASDADPSYNKQLPYVPRHTANLSVRIDLGRASVNLLHSIVGERFTTDDNSTSLAGYRLTHGNVRANIPVGSSVLFAKFEVDNIFDRDYEVFQHYPMPRGSVRFSLGAEY